MKKTLLIITGSLFLVLGTIGIILPLLPTTPFYLLSAACYMRGSERMYRLLIERTPVGNYIRNYLTYHAVPRKSKIKSVIFLWLLMVPAIIFSSDTFWVRGILALIGIGVTVHLLSLKTLTAEMIAEHDLQEDGDYR